ncbi:hypothetical protein Tco_0141006 [Tanacetum coccineum]
MNYEVAHQSGIPLRCDFEGVTEWYQSTGYSELRRKLIHFPVVSFIDAEKELMVHALKDPNNEDIALVSIRIYRNAFSATFYINILKEYCFKNRDAKQIEEKESSLMREHMSPNNEKLLILATTLRNMFFEEAINIISNVKERPSMNRIIKRIEEALYIQIHGATEYGSVKNHKKTVKNGQARTRESEEYKKKPKDQNRSQKCQASVKDSQSWCPQFDQTATIDAQMIEEMIGQD